MEKLVYDRTTKLFTLDTPDEAIFLGPIAHAVVSLQKKCDLTPAQAREAVLQAVFNGGVEVCLNAVRRVAQESEFFSKAS